MIELRPYQSYAVSVLKSRLAAKDNVLFQAPCGAGKTVCFSSIAAWLEANGRRCLVLLDRENLVTQTAARIQEWTKSRVGIACASAGSKQAWQRVVVASRQTLSSMLKNGNADAKFNLIILDEAHLVNPACGQYRNIIDRLKSNYPATRLLGCTATPYRLISGPIYGQKNTLFESVDHRVLASDLLDQGFLAPLTWKIRKTDFMAALDRIEKTSTGELDEKAQSEVVGQKTFIEGVFEAWQRECTDRRTLVYALNIAHAEAIAEYFTEHGVQTWVVHSKMSPWQVKYCINEFMSGQGVLVNVGLLVLGSDIPCTSAIILARRTMSASLFFQIVGRGTRLFPGKTDCRVIDLAGSALIHGIDLDNPVMQTIGDQDREPRIKICPMCETATGMQARTCKECGFLFPVDKIPEAPLKQERIKDAGQAGELVEFKGFTVVRCDLVRYKAYHSGKSSSAPPTVECVYRIDGRRWIRQWLCPEHTHGTFPQKKSKWYWLSLGGRKPYPVTVADWCARQGELSTDLLITLDESGKYPVVKKVEVNQERTYAVG